MKAKKFLSVLLAASMISGTAAAVSAEQTSSTVASFDANELTINDYGNGFVNPPYGLSYGTEKGTPVYGNARLYKLENVFGLGEGEYGVEMVAREQRKDKPYFMINAVDYKYDLSKDFYITANTYIGSATAGDYFRLGGEFSLKTADGKSSRNTKYPFFRSAGNGAGVVQASARTDSIRRLAAYTEENWYNTAIAYDKDTRKFRIYIDGQDISEAAISDLAAGTCMGVVTANSGDTLERLSLGMRLEQAAENLSTAPAWTVIKDMRIVEEKYNPVQSETIAASNTYKVDAKSLVVERGATADMAVSKVSGIEAGTTAAKFLNNMIAPEDGSMAVVKISADDKKTIAVAADETVTSDMKLFVKSADGSMKLYDLDVEASQDDLPQISLSSGAPARYTFDEANNLFTVPDTTVGALKSYIVPGSGTTVKVTNYSQTIEREDSNPVTDTMKVVAEKNGNKAVYSIEIKNNTALADTSETLKKQADGATLLAGSFASKAFTETTANNKRLIGIGDQFGGSTVSIQNGTDGAFTATKETLKSGTPAYKFVTNANGWVQNNTGTAGAAVTNYSLGTKTIINYKVQLAEGAMSEMYTYQTKPDGGGTSFTGTGTDGTKDIGFRLAFRADNNIYFGKQAYHKGNELNLGSYENGKEYDVTIAAQTPNNTSEIVIEGIYLEGEKIFPTTYNQKAEDGFYHITGSTSLYSLVRSINFGVQGTSYLGGVKIYMADDYNPDKAAFVDEITDPVAPDKVTDFGVKIESPLTEGTLGRIYGWSGMTAGEIKAKIDSSVNTAVSVCDVTGSAEIKDTAALENGMIIKIYDVNYADNALYYVLASENNMGAWESSVKETEDGSKIVNITRTIKIYDPVAKTPLTYVLAAYEGEKLVNVGIGYTTLENDGSYTLNASVRKTDGATYKAMLWNTNTLAAVEAAAPIIAE